MLPQARERIIHPLIAYLVKDFPNVGFRFPKPHGEQLRTLDGDEVGLTFICNGLGQQGFTTSRRPIEEDSLGGCHAKLEEFVRMLHRILEENKTNDSSANSIVCKKTEAIFKYFSVI